MTKVIVVTGAGSGLGRALARRFHRDGDIVFLLGRTASKLEKVTGELGERATAIACDIGRPEDVRAAFAQIAQSHPTIDVLINNAAMIDYTTLAAASDAHIMGTIGTNLGGTLLCCRAAINMMGRGGHIINVSSEAVDEPYPHHVVYQATKGGIETMSKHLQNEVKPQGIRVTLVRAGPMYDDERTMQASSEAVDAFHAACVERGIDLSTLPVAHFDSVLWLFRSLVDMPPDMHVDVVRFTSRRP
jgi:meso-butanediol dehydrogenase / (S,S)-butanediol dehydrogenase / diacetyl reductase